MPRTVGAISSYVDGAEYDKSLLIEIGYPSSSNPTRYTNRGTSVTQTIESVSRTFTPYDIVANGIGQNQDGSLADPTLVIGNVNKVWSAAQQNNTLRNTPVVIWEGWWQPNGGAWVTATRVFTGKMDRITYDDTSFSVTLIPFTSPFSVGVPGHRFVPTCQWVFKGERCGYKLQRPAAPTLAQTTGTMAAGTYYYRLSAVDAYGESLASYYVSTTITATHGVAVSWPAITGATAYRIYGRTWGGEQLITQTTSTSYNDTGSVTPSGAPPTINTTGVGTTCDRTDAACATYGNSQRFGGFKHLPNPTTVYHFGGSAYKPPTKTGTKSR